MPKSVSVYKIFIIIISHPLKLLIELNKHENKFRNFFLTKNRNYPYKEDIDLEYNFIFNVKTYNCNCLNWQSSKSDRLS